MVGAKCEARNYNPFYRPRYLAHLAHLNLLKFTHTNARVQRERWVSSTPVGKPFYILRLTQASWAAKTRIDSSLLGSLRTTLTAMSQRHWPGRRLKWLAPTSLVAIRL